MLLRSIVVALLGGAALALAAPAAANPPGPHDPMGAVSAVKAVTGGVQFTGWAADPDALTTNDTVFVVVDGRARVAATTTSLPNAKVQTRYGTGPTPGFTLVAPLDNKPHTACLVANNTGAGMATLLKCVSTPLGTTLTSAQLAAHNPVGGILSTSTTSTTFHVTGWSSDPDYFPRRATVVLYVDGAPAATVGTHTYPGPRPTGAGTNSAFAITVPVAKGMHVGCIWAVNVGLGSGNTFVGCTAGDTRGPAGSAKLTVPRLNQEVLTEAEKHIGQAYVWGATGPKTFDCSGLVKYSYGKFGYTTPRTSQQQALAARLIPATRALPGDLVFWHDSEGNVYHVSIYVSPGRAFAAIDESEGVNYQNLYDPTILTYGSFTHI